MPHPYADKLAQFAQLVACHDLTYQYSDDGSVYDKGYQSYWNIVEFSKTIDRADAVKIWNANVDKSLNEEYRKEFYWKS